MVIHFDTRELAVSHLEQNGWEQIKNGNWVSSDGRCAACINPRFGEVVVIQFWEI